MNNVTRRRFGFLIYSPFLIFEWAGLIYSAKIVLFEPQLQSEQNSFQIASAFVFIWAICALSSKFYSYERNLTFSKQLQRYVVCCALFMGIIYFVNLLVLAFNSLPLYPLLLLVIIVFVLKAITIITLFYFRKNVALFQERILVYDSDRGKNFIDDINGLKRTGYKPNLVQKRLFSPESLEELRAKIFEDKINTIVLPLEVALKKSMEHITALNWKGEVNVKFIADYDSPITGRSAQFFGLTQVLKHQVSPLDLPVQKMFKRIFDVLFSTIVIILLLSWFVPLMAIIIRVDSKGPAFFFQRRPGRFGKEFRCIKFRSMTLNKNTEKSASRNDSRITSVGKLIRKTSIDEFPQFFNVFLGQMSIVGPRPNLLSQNKHYSQVLDEYEMRMYLKPGITGLAQVSGARGGIEDDIEMKHRVKYDIFYIRNWSFALDIKIIIRTMLNMIRGEDNAY